MFERLATLFFLCALVGCPKAPKPDDPPADTATSPMPPPLPAPTSSLEGGWTVKVTSNDPSVDPSMFEGRRAKIFFDHRAAVKDGKVVVEHGELAPTTADPDDARAIDDLLSRTDWEALVAEVKAEEPSEGGTSFGFEIARGDTKLKLTTGDPSAYPALAELLDLLKKVSGVPGP